MRPEVQQALKVAGLESSLLFLLLQFALTRVWSRTADPVPG